MENFKKQLYRLKGGSNLKLGIILLLAAMILTGMGITKGFTSYEAFDPTYDKNVYASLDVTYVMGPFAELAEGTNTTNEYYIAETSDGYWLLIGTGPNSTLPIYGVDVMDEDLASLSPVVLQGKSTEVPAEMASYLADFFEGSEYGITADNYSDYFGSRYLDTTVRASQTSALFYFLAVVILIIALLMQLPGMKAKKQMKARIAELESNGWLQTLYSDFSSGEPFYSPALKLALSDNYILDFTAPNGFGVLFTENITNVYRCSMVNGTLSPLTYIALETNRDTRTLVAPSAGRGNDFETALSRLKAAAERNRNL